MKRIYLYIISFVIIAESLASCNLLDLPIYDNIEKKDFYKTEDDIRLAVIGAYGVLSDFYERNYVHFSELTSDNAMTTGESTDLAHLDKFSVSSVNSNLKSGWQSAYRCIYNVNEIIAAIPNISFSTQEKHDQYLGEVLFIRALSYFNLVRMFGDLPKVTTVITQEQARHLTRTSADEIYSDIIILDLQEASRILPEKYTGEDIGRATSFAAASLLGKVYLTIHDYVSAEEVLGEVIENGPYILLPVFADIFNPDNANHAESIFEIQFEKTRSGGSFWSCAAHARELAAEFGVSTSSATMPTASIRNAFEQDSERFKASIGRGKNNGPYYIKKHYMELSIQNHSDDNWPVLRYADVLLMYAEAKNEITESPTEDAVNCVNYIRRRAYGLDVNTPSPEHDVTDAEKISKDVFRHVVWDERRLELAFEGHRWFDLVRTGEYMDVMNQHFKDDFKGNYVVQNYNNLFPVPQYEIDVNPNLLPNNPGY